MSDARAIERKRFRHLVTICVVAWVVYTGVHALGGHGRAVMIHACGALATFLVLMVGVWRPVTIRLMSHLNLAVATATLSAHAWNGGMLNDSAWFLTLVPLFAAYQMGPGRALQWTGIVVTVLLVLGVLAQRLEPVPEWELGPQETARNRVLLVLLMSAFGVASARATREEKERARRGEQRLEALFTQAAEGIIIVDENGQVESLNNAALEMFQIEAGDGVGQEISQFIPGFELGAGRYESEGRRSDGSAFPVKLSSVWVELKHHRSCSIILEDITQRRADRQALRRAHDQAQAASRAKTEFLATMSHEFRTPLNSIIGFSQMLIEQQAELADDKQMRFQKNILGSSRHLLEMINRLLGFSEAEAGKMTFSPENVSLKPIVREVLDQLTGLAERRSIKLGVEGEDLRAYVDPIRFRQILTNLVGNSIKFGVEGGFATVRLAARDGEVVISVSDDGKGIEEADLDRVFEPFTQLDSGYDRKAEGTGLGLTLTRRMVELQGGRIWVESQGCGQGSAFSFSLPASEAALLLD